MEYVIVDDSSTTSLALRVQDAISKGWEPQGGVAVVYNAGGWRWAQAMIRKVHIDRSD